MQPLRPIIVWRRDGKRLTKHVWFPQQVRAVTNAAADKDYTRVFVLLAIVGLFWRFLLYVELLTIQ